MPRHRTARATDHLPAALAALTLLAALLPPGAAATDPGDCFDFAAYLAPVFQDPDAPFEVVTLEVADGLLYAACSWDGVRIIDVRGPMAHPRILGAWDAIDYVDDLALRGDLCYLAGRDDGLVVLDVSDPTAPVEIARGSSLHPVTGVVLHGDHALVCARDYGITVFDIADPAAPVAVSGRPLAGEPWSLAREGDLLAVAGNEGGVFLLDVQDPGAMVLLAVLEPFHSVLDVDLEDGLLCAVGSGEGFHPEGKLAIIDARDPAHPAPAAVIDLPQTGRAVHLHDGLAYVGADESSLLVAEVARGTAPTGPRLVGRYAGTTLTRDVRVDAGRAYVGGYWGGWCILDVGQPRAPVALAQAPLVGSAQDVATSGTLAHVAAWDGGLHVLDVADPRTPRRLGKLATPGRAAAVAVRGDRVCVADYDAGLAVIDASDPARPTLLGSVATPSTARAVALAGDLAYVADRAGGLQVVDLSDPTTPGITGALDTDGFASGLAITRDRAYVADGFGGLVIAAIDDPAAPRLLGTLALPGDCRDVALHPNSDLSAGEHVHVLTSEQLATVDVTDPAAPVVVATRELTGQPRSLVAFADRLYVADGQAGVHVFALHGPDPGEHLGVLPPPDGARGLAAVGRGVLHVAAGSGGLVTVPLACGPQDVRPPDHPTAADTPDPTVARTEAGSGQDGPPPSGDQKAARPGEAAITGVAPNPCNPRTVCTFALARSQPVDLAVFDLRGRRVRQLATGIRPAGEHAVRWDGRDARGRAMSSGVYLLRLRTPAGADSRRISLLR